MSIERFLRALSEIMTAKTGMKVTYRLEETNDVKRNDGNAA